MPWTALHTVILVLLLVIAVLVVALIHRADRAGLPTRRQRRAWNGDVPHAVVWRFRRRP